MAKANRTKKAGERGWGEVGGKRVGVGFADKGGSEMEEEGGRGERREGKGGGCLGSRGGVGMGRGCAL